MGDNSWQRARTAVPFRGPLAPTASPVRADAVPGPVARAERAPPSLEISTKDLLDESPSIPRTRTPRRGSRPTRPLFGLKLLQSRCIDDEWLRRLLATPPTDLERELGDALLTPAQVAALLERFPLSSDWKGLSRVEAFERLLLRCAAPRSERLALLSCFDEAGPEVAAEARRILDEAPPCTMIAPLAAARSRGERPGLTGMQPGASVGVLAHHLARRTVEGGRVELSAIEIRELLAAAPREDRLELLKVAWGYWKGDRPELIWKALPAQDQKAGRAHLARAPTNEMRAELHARPFVDVLSRAVESTSSFPPHLGYALAGEACTSAQLRQLLMLLTAGNRREAFDVLALSWNGKGGRAVILDAFEDPVHLAEVAATLATLPTNDSRSLGEPGFADVCEKFRKRHRSSEPPTYAGTLHGKTLTSLQARKLLALQLKDERADLFDLLLLHLRPGEPLDDLLSLLPDDDARKRAACLHRALSQADRSELEQPDFARFSAAFRGEGTVMDRIRFVSPPATLRDRLRRLTRPPLPETLTSLQLVSLMAWGQSFDLLSLEELIVRWRPDANEPLLRLFAERDPNAAALIDARCATSS